MPVGLSDGTSYKDSDEWITTVSTMPPGASTEPAGAFKSTEGTQTPGNSEKVESSHVYLDKSGPGYHMKITDEDIDTAINVGLSAGPGTMAGVRSAAIGSKLADLGHAQVLEAAGEHPDTIWSKTGFGRGADARWRYEINDSAAKYDPRWTKDHAEAVESKLSSILDHPELYKAYPLLKDVKVIKDPGYAAEGAAYEAGSGPGKLEGAQIRMGVKAAEDQGVLMHEIQHAIQGYEGFAKGGAPSKQVNYLRYTSDVKTLRPEMEAILEKNKDPSAIWTTKEVERNKYLTAVAAKYKEYTEAAYTEAHRLYQRLAGETESRNVDTRLLLTEAERRKMPPTWTEDTSRSQQIVRDEPTTTTAYGIIDKGKFVKP